MMEQNVDSNAKYLLEQLITARKEIKDLREEINDLRYVHERDVRNIKRLVRLAISTNGLASFSEECEMPAASLKNNELLTSKSTNDCFFVCRPIGALLSGSPNIDRICGKIVLFKSVFKNYEHVLQVLQEFSHMWILYHSHKNEAEHLGVEVGPHPGLNSIKTGIFSTRLRHCPCPVALTLVPIIKIEDNIIYFESLDVMGPFSVFDMRPYIPYSDNPLHVDKVLQSIRLERIRKCNTGLSSLASFSNADAWIPNDTDKGMSANYNDKTCGLREWSAIYSKSIADNPSLEHVSSLSLSCVSSSIDISKDKELALKLQAEEFNDYLLFKDVSVNSEGSEDKEVTSVRANKVNYNAGIGENDGQNFRNSRSLDQADPPRTRYATDMEMISKGAINLTFNDNFPSAWDNTGRREAPDGEECLSYDKKSSSSTTTTSKQITEARYINVRVPGWMLNPKESPFKINFSTRSLKQLQEISKDKADEKKLLIESILKEDPRIMIIKLIPENEYHAVLIHDLHVFCRYNDYTKQVAVSKITVAGHTCNCGEADWQCIGHTEVPYGECLP